MNRAVIDVFSIQEPSVLLHRIVSPNHSLSARADLTEPDDNLQVSYIPLLPGRTTRPHGHQPRDVILHGLVPLEVWILSYGRLNVSLFDINGTFLRTELITKGYLLIAYAGGHSLEALESSELIEIKQGPYLGNDLRYFNELESNAI